ncbi:hypothetical protein ACWEQ4_01280 [Rhodococcus sp. NPDC003994]
MGLFWGRVGRPRGQFPADWRIPKSRQGYNWETLSGRIYSFRDKHRRFVVTKNGPGRGLSRRRIHGWRLYVTVDQNTAPWTAILDIDERDGWTLWALVNDKAQVYADSRRRFVCLVEIDERHVDQVFAAFVEKNRTY